MTLPPNYLTYKGHTLSYWYANYRDVCRTHGRPPLPLAEWVHDPAHSPQFREAFQVVNPTTV